MDYFYRPLEDGVRGKEVMEFDWCNRDHEDNLNMANNYKGIEHNLCPKHPYNYMLEDL